MEILALARPNELRHLNSRPRFRHELGSVPASELGTVVPDYRDDVTSSGARLRLVLAESDRRPSGSKEPRNCGLGRFVRDVGTIFPAPAFPHVVSKGQHGLLS